MKATITRILALGLALILMISQPASGALGPEVEPNNNPANATPANASSSMTGSIDVEGDLDYYRINHVNSTWGYIALLDTSSSTTSKDATLTAYDSNGTTVLQSNAGVWEKGSGIALQSFTTGQQYLKVEESGNNATISQYNLRYFNTIATTQPEVNPNNTLAQAQPSGFTHAGTISAAGDQDCYAFHGRDTDVFLFALNGDPEKDSSPIDPVLTLYNPAGTLINTVNTSGTAGSEFLETTPLSGSGRYVYCVSAASGTPGDTATYKVGLVRNTNLYRPEYTMVPAWTNRPASGFAMPGDVLTFTLNINNSSPVIIPGAINFSTTLPACLGFIDSVPVSSSISGNTINWYGYLSNLAVGGTYTITANFRALKGCATDFSQSTSVDYFFTGHGNEVPFAIKYQAFLPIVKGIP